MKPAYLNGKLDEEIFMKQPEGFEVPGKESWVLRLLKSIYGLKQSGCIWNRLLNDELRKLGFSCCRSDSCVYV